MQFTFPVEKINDTCSLEYCEYHSCVLDGSGIILFHVSQKVEREVIEAVKVE